MYASGLGRVVLEVTAQNDAAVRLYRRLGFRRARVVYKAVSQESGVRGQGSGVSEEGHVPPSLAPLPDS